MSSRFKSFKKVLNSFSKLLKSSSRFPKIESPFLSMFVNATFRYNSSIAFTSPFIASTIKSTFSDINSPSNTEFLI